MDEMRKLGIILVPICWLVGGIITLIMFLACTGEDKSIWPLSYVLGLVTALLNFGLMMKSNRKMALNVNNNHPKPVRQYMGAYALRVLVFIAVFGAIAYNQFASKSPSFNILAGFIGYITLKFVMIILLIIRKGKVDNGC